MGWQDNINNVIFIIRTGDGKLYYPDWKPGEMSVDYNASIFEFIAKPGSLVARKLPKARKFPVTFWFQGDNCIDQANAFMSSADDSRVWLVHHPYYGDITCQPVSISRNDSLYNASEITVELWETILTNGPVLKIPVYDGTDTRVAKYHMISPVDYASKAKPLVADRTKIQDNAVSIDALTDKILTDAYYADYQVLKSTMFAAVDKLTTAPAAAIAAIQEIVLAPAKFQFSIQTRAQLFIAQFNDISSKISNKPSRNDKVYFEVNAGMMVGALAQTFINPIDGDYVSRQDVVNASTDLNNLYARYLNLLDTLYVKDPNPNISYSASSGTQDALQDLIIFVLSGLEEIAFNSKQERIVTTDRDTNLILLVHKYVGMDQDDINMDTFRSINKLKNNSLFIVRKGTTIKYFI